MDVKALKEAGIKSRRMFFDTLAEGIILPGVIFGNRLIPKDDYILEQTSENPTESGLTRCNRLALIEGDSTVDLPR
jgi:hypothetical protein